MERNPKSTGKFPVIVHDTKVGLVHLKNIPASIKIPFYGVVGTVAFAQKTPSGDLYVECKSKAQQQKLLDTTDLAGIVVQCYEPTPSTDGVVTGLTDPHVLQNHPRVLKYSLITHMVTRIIFATSILPNEIKIGNKRYKVDPYVPPIKRCTNCQKLHHFRKTCTLPSQCSKCGQGHMRSVCTSLIFKCVNCKGDHSSAYKKCPMQQKIREQQRQRSQTYDPRNEFHLNRSNNQNDFGNDKQIEARNIVSTRDEVQAELSTNIPSTKNFVSHKQEIVPDKEKGPNKQKVISNSDHQTSTSKASASSSDEQKQNPSFMQFILTTVKPIMSASPNASFVNQMFEVYKSTYQIQDDNLTIDEAEKRDANNILGLSSSYVHVSNPNTTDRDFDDSVGSNRLHSKDPKNKNLKSLDNIDTNTNEEYLIIGDSVVRDIPNREEGSSKIKVTSVSGLNINDCNAWLVSKMPLNHIKKVIFHVGINTCKKDKVIDKNTWISLINNISKVFVNAQIMMSSIVPPRGKGKNCSIRSNISLQKACDHFDIEYIDNYHLFTVNGNPRIALYKDHVHLNIKGKAILSDRLYNYLSD